MATYAEHAAARERRARRQEQDAVLGARHRMFDLMAQDRRMKYDRPQFAVVTASDAFRAGYDAIDWGRG